MKKYIVLFGLSLCCVGLFAQSKDCFETACVECKPETITGKWEEKKVEKTVACPGCKEDVKVEVVEKTRIDIHRRTYSLKADDHFQEIMKLLESELGYKSEISRLKDALNRQNETITSLQSDNETLKKKNSNLDTKNVDLKNLKKKEKGRLKNEIGIIIKQKSHAYLDKTSRDLLDIALQRLVDFGEDRKELDMYISNLDIVIKAKDHLKSPYDKSKVDEQYEIVNKSLSNLDGKYSGIYEEMKELTVVLFKYREFCRKLDKELDNYIKVNADAQTVIDLLKDKKWQYAKYPYLFNKIEVLINELNNGESTRKALGRAKPGC